LTRLVGASFLIWVRLPDARWLRRTVGISRIVVHASVERRPWYLLVAPIRRQVVASIGGRVLRRALKVWVHRCWRISSKPIAQRLELLVSQYQDLEQSLKVSSGQRPILVIVGVIRRVVLIPVRVDWVRNRVGLLTLRVPTVMLLVILRRDWSPLRSERSWLVFTLLLHGCSC
jgi:hypothetical protein